MLRTRGDKWEEGSLCGACCWALNWEGSFSKNSAHRGSGGRAAELAAESSPLFSAGFFLPFFLFWSLRSREKVRVVVRRRNTPEYAKETSALRLKREVGGSKLGNHYCRHLGVVSGALGRFPVSRSSEGASR